MRRHELDLFSLVAGLVFAAVALGHLLDVATDLDFNGRWIAPIVLVALGVAGLAGVLRNRDDAQPNPPGTGGRTQDTPADAEDQGADSR